MMMNKKFNNVLTVKCYFQNSRLIMLILDVHCIVLETKKYEMFNQKENLNNKILINF